jgi:F-type H+-transporting ATPase subunit b
MRIDWWTLALQTINVLILIWILARFFFRPIINIVAKRQEEAKKLLTDAALARQEAADVRSEAVRARAEVAAERERLLAEARNAARVEKQNLLEQSSREIVKLNSEAKAAIAREQAAAEQAIIDHATEISIEIARRLLARFPHRDILHAFVDEICREVHGLSSEVRDNLTSAAATGHPIEVVTATPLSGEETQQVAEALKEAFGLELSLAFHSDPAILAGIELHGQDAVIRNSWRADLERIRKELNRDQHASGS